MLPPIIFEDEHLLAFDKPSGLRVAPDRWDPDLPCLMDFIHQHKSPAFFNVHRIDADTSGLVLCAKNKAALSNLTGQFQSRNVLKRYLAIVMGAPVRKEMEISQPIMDNPQRPGTMKPGGGKRFSAVTRYKILERWRHHTLLQVMPVTGKTHQIRVHLAYIGHPVLADAIYGSATGLKLSSIKPRYKFKPQTERPLLARLALHAAELEFTHPASGETIKLAAPLHKDMEVAIKYLRRFSTLA